MIKVIVFLRSDIEFIQQFETNKEAECYCDGFNAGKDMFAGDDAMAVIYPSDEFDEMVEMDFISAETAAEIRDNS